MRLLLDLQCVQSTSSRRGIGRYALCLAKALVEEGAGHRVDVLLNGGDDAERLLRARKAIESFLPAEQVHVFDAAWPWQHDPSPGLLLAAQAAYRSAVTSLAPDALLVGSVFEGDKENVLSLGASEQPVPTAAVLYDLIPAADPKTYLLGPGADDYWRRWEDLKRCDRLLAISVHAASQAQTLLRDECPATRTVWGAAYPSGAFPDFEHPGQGPAELREPYVLAVGGDHPRKNLDRLVQAWALLPAATRARARLVVACRLNVGTLRRLRRLSRQGGLGAEDVLLLGEVSEQHLDQLYRGALAFVFPSLEEGLGLPPLEAMRRGCPTLLARGSSLSELTDDEESFFDGSDTRSIARALHGVVEDADLRKRLRGVAERTSACFTWSRTAQLAWAALVDLLPERPPAAHPPALVPPVRFAEAHRLRVQPGPVRVVAADLEGAREPIPPGAGVGLVAPVAPAVRWALSAATAVVADRATTARLAAAGAFELPIVEEEGDLPEVARRDFHEALRTELTGVPLSDAEAGVVVRASTRTPRWLLRRRRPVWLLLSASSDLPAVAGALTAAAGGAVDVAAGSVAAVVLAAAADVVLVDLGLAASLHVALHEARCRGASVVVVLPAGEDSHPGRGLSFAVTEALSGAAQEAASWAQVVKVAGSAGRPTGMSEGHRALVVCTPAAAREQANGASLRVDDVRAALEQTGHTVEVRTWPECPREGDWCVGAAVSFASSAAVRDLRRVSQRVWLDATDSWLLLNGSGLRSGRRGSTVLRSGRGSYVVRGLRDGARLLRMPPPDLVTWISGADRHTDRWTVRGRERLVLPAAAEPITRRPVEAGPRRVVLAGDWTYPANVDGLRWLEQAVLPHRALQGSATDWAVHVFGQQVPPLHHPRLRAGGYLADAADLFRDGDVHIAPVRFGAGVKRKVVQPLAAGLPVVTTSAGAHGLRLHPLLAVADTASAFAARLAAALEAPAPTGHGVGALADVDESGAVLKWLTRGSCGCHGTTG